MVEPVPPSAAKPLAPRLIGAALAIAAIFAVLELTDARAWLSFSALAEHREWLVGRVEALGLAAALIFVLVYALCTALSLPTGLLLSTAGGFLFGTWWGGLLNVIGGTLGATIIFLAARTVLGDALRARAGPWLDRLEAGFRDNELSYLLVLRLVPLFPFWLVNLAPAFLGVKTSNYVIGTFFGIFPGAIVFASVGTGLGEILASGRTPDGAVLLQPQVILPIAGLALLALTPVLFERLRRRVPAGDLS